TVGAFPADELAQAHAASDQAPGSPLEVEPGIDLQPAPAADEFEPVDEFEPADGAPAQAAREPGRAEFEPAPDNVRPFPLTPAEPPPEAADDQVAEEVPFAAALLRPDAKPARWRIGALWLLLGALLGVALFAWGLFWVFNSRGAPGPGGIDPMVLGWLAGIAGVGFFGVAAYMLLDRLGRADDEIEGESDI